MFDNSFLDLSDTPTITHRKKHLPPSAPPPITKPLPLLPKPTPPAQQQSHTRRMERTNRPPPLALFSPNYSTHQVELSGSACSAFEPLSPFVPSGNSSPRGSPTTLHSPSLWLSPTGILEPVGPKMSKHESDFQDFTISPTTPTISTELDHTRVRKIVKVMRTLGHDVPVQLVCPTTTTTTTTPTAPPPSSAFDSDDDERVEAGSSSKRAGLKRKLQAFVFGNGIKTIRHRRASLKADAENVGTTTALSSSKKRRRHVHICKAPPTYNNNPASPPFAHPDSDSTDTEDGLGELPTHANATYSRRPSLVESLLFGPTTTTTTTTVPIIYNRRDSHIAESSPELDAMTFEPFDLNVTSPSTDAHFSPPPRPPRVHQQHQQYHLLAPTNPPHRTSSSSAELSLFEFDLALFPFSPAPPHHDHDHDHEHEHEHEQHGQAQSFPSGVLQPDIYEPSTASSVACFPPTPVSSLSGYTIVAVDEEEY